MEAIDTVCVDLEMYEGCRFHGEKIRLGKRVGLWGSPAGKRNHAKRIVSMIPEHAKYVEPFAGGAAVFYRKEPSKKEVLADSDPELVSAYKFVRDATATQIAKLKGMNWVISKPRYLKLTAMEPTKLSPVMRFYRFAYRRRSSFLSQDGKSPSGKWHIGFDRTADGTRATLMDNFEQTQERLQGVSILSDGMKAIRAHDSADTFFYLDPPYPKYAQRVGENVFDEDGFIAQLKKLKGKFLLHYEVSAKSKFEKHGWTVRTIPARVMQRRSDDMKQKSPRLLEVMNYNPQMFRVGKLDTNFSELSKDEIVKAAKTRKQFLRRNKVTSRPLQRAIHRFFKKIVRREVTKLQRNGTIRLFSNKAGKAQRVRKNVNDLVLIEKTVEDEDELRALIRTYGIRTYEKAGKRTSNALGGVWKVRPIELDLLIRDKDILLAETAGTILAELQETVRDVLIESSQMQPRPGIGDITRELYSRTLHTGAVSPARAERIARTETASYENSGIMQGYTVSGIKRIKWLSIIDGRTRAETRNLKWQRPPADHVVMNGVEVEMGKPFVNKNTGASLRYPGDPRGAPQEIINCRCTTMPVVDLKR